MKKILCTSIITLLVLTGCTTSVCRHYDAAPGQTNSAGEPVKAELRGRNYGYFLFYAIPLWCGHAYSPNEEEWDLWRNMLRPRDMREMLTRRAARLGAEKITDIKIRESSCGFWSLWIIWHRSISATALAVGEKRR